MLAGHLDGLTLDEAEGLVRTFKGVMQGEQLTEEQEESLGDIVALQGVRQFPIRIKCALLGWTTLQDAIADYRKGLARVLDDHRRAVRQQFGRSCEHHRRDKAHADYRVRAHFLGLSLHPFARLAATGISY